MTTQLSDKRRALARQRKQIAIAELDGWVPIDGHPGYWRKNVGGLHRIRGLEFEAGIRLKDDDVHPLPDYLGDLNEMHRVIMAQPRDVRRRINQALCATLRDDDPSYMGNFLDRVINATAAERGDAFLAALTSPTAVPDFDFVLINAPVAPRTADNNATADTVRVRGLPGRTMKEVGRRGRAV
jgi:hypothetical protein